MVEATEITIDPVKFVLGKSYISPKQISAEDFYEIIKESTRPPDIRFTPHTGYLRKIKWLLNDFGPHTPVPRIIDSKIIEHEELPVHNENREYALLASSSPLEESPAIGTERETVHLIMAPGQLTDVHSSLAIAEVLWIFRERSETDDLGATSSSTVVYEAKSIKLYPGERFIQHLASGTLQGVTALRTLEKIAENYLHETERQVQFASHRLAVLQGRLARLCSF